MNADRLKALSCYAEAHFPIIKCRGKRSIEKDWNNKAPMTPQELARHFGSWEENCAIVLREGDLVIDADPRRYPEGRDVLVDFFKDAQVSEDELLTTAHCIKTGGDGWHIWMLKPKDLRIKGRLAEYPGLEFKTYGSYMVAVGSVHPDTGKLYVDARGRDIREICEASNGILELIEMPEQEQETADIVPVDFTDTVEPVVERYTEYLSLTKPAVEGQEGDSTTYHVALKGRDQGLSKAKVLDLMTQHYNPRCEPPWSGDELAKKVDNAFEYAKGAAGSESPQADFVEVRDPGKHPLWRGWDNASNGKGKLRTVNNTVNWFLLPKTGLMDTIGYNELAQATNKMKPLPWDQPGMKYPHPWTDNDTCSLRLHLSRHHRYDATPSMINDAVLGHSMHYGYHPIKDYLRGLKWDGVNRLEMFLIDHAMAEDSPYTRATTKMFMMQAVMRAMYPGCKADYVVILEGDQGVGKTQLLEVLGGDWYADVTIDPHNKDCVDALLGKWIVEIAEMEVTRRADVQALRAFISRHTDCIRLPYGRRTADIRRTCIFAGTMNPDATKGYLVDTTGNRRFWPVPVGVVDLPTVKAVRDQLWAEAMQLVSVKEEGTYITDPVILKVAVEMQESRMTEDPWMAPISNHVLCSNPDFLTVHEVWRVVLGGPETQLNIQQQRRIAGCLKALGYRQHQQRVNGVRQRGWRREID